MPVSSPCERYVEIISQWSRARDCYEGGDSVKAAGTKYLPMLDSHKFDLPTPFGPITGPYRYLEYKNRALFYNAMKRTVQGLSGMICQKPPTLDATPEIEEHAKDITLSGTTLEEFEADWVKELIGIGNYGVLIEMSAEPTKKPRPYWVPYRQEDIVNWESIRKDGKESLTMVVLREVYKELKDPKDPFVKESREQYRLLELFEGKYRQSVWRQVRDATGKLIEDDWTIYRAPDQSSDYIVPTRRGEPLEFIPFVFDPCAPRPPLIDLVDVNLSHYRASADLKHGLHCAALPTPVIFGALGGESSTPLMLGSGVAWQGEKGGSVTMLEVHGPGFAAIKSDMDDMKLMMATLGARLLELQDGPAETAFAVSMRHGGEHATIRTIAQEIELMMTSAVQIHGWWIGTESEPSEVDADVQLNKDFFAIRATSDEIKTALLLYQSDAITFDTFYDILTKGGWTRDNVDSDQEKKELEKQKQEKINAMPAPAPADGTNPDSGGNPDSVPGDTGYKPVGKVVTVGNPYHVEKRGDKFCVVKSSTGEIVPGGTHATKADADKHLRAMEANVKK